MEQSIINAITTLGLPTVIAIVLWKEIQKRDKLNREDTTKQIEELKSENKEEKKTFREALDIFKKSVDEFRAVGIDMAEIKGEIKEINKDIVIIKENIKEK